MAQYETTNYCLPQKYSRVFLAAINKGDLEVNHLSTLSSAERRDLFSNLLGEENAQSVNALFESKLLLKNQRRGMVDWVAKVSGLKERQQLDAIDKIQKLDKLLQPIDEQCFLADLANEKLGITVSAEEAQKLFDASTKALELKEIAKQSDWSDFNPKYIAWGRATQDLTDLVETMKPSGRTWVQVGVDVLNISKTLQTSLDLSAMFNQGWGMLSTKNGWKGLPKMLEYFASEENYKDLNAYIITHPDYIYAQDGKLGLTTLSDKLSLREEAIQSSLVEAANQYLTDKVGVPNLIRMSNRAFTGYLNYVRFTRFSDLLNAARFIDEDITVGSRAVRDIAKVVNDFTGRGSIGTNERYADAVPLLNTIFYSPRKISATINMFNPQRYLDPRISQTARHAAMRQLVGSLAGTGAIAYLAHAVGFKVNFNPIDTDFGKIDIAGQKFDISGGNAIYLRLLARLISGQEVTGAGNEVELGESFTAPTRASLLIQFFRNKLAPTAAMLADAAYGKDPIGRPFNLSTELQERAVPLTIKSYLDFWNNNLRDNPEATVAILPSVMAIFGVSMDSPLPAASYDGVSIWGDPSYPLSPAPRNAIDKEFEKLGPNPGLPGNTINGVKLTKEQYKSYVALAGRFAKQQLEPLVTNPGWSSIPNAQRLAIMKRAMQSSKATAQTIIQMQSRGSGNDILQQMFQNKYEQNMELITPPSDTQE